VSMIAGYFLGSAEKDAQYGGGWSLPFGRLLGLIGCAVFGILSFRPFFAAWREITGFWPHFLLVLLFLWIIFLLVYALMFLIKLFTG
jgi:hypothetical protein